MRAKTFTSKKKYLEAINMVYDFHEQVFNTVVALLKRKGDIVLKRGIKFSFLEMEGNYVVHAVRLDDSKRDFYLEASDVCGDEYKIDWTQINHDMIIVEWLMGLKWHDLYDFEY